MRHCETGDCNWRNRVFPRIPNFETGEHNFATGIIFLINSIFIFLFNSNTVYELLPGWFGGKSTSRHLISWGRRGACRFSGADPHTFAPTPTLSRLRSRLFHHCEVRHAMLIPVRCSLPTATFPCTTGWVRVGTSVHATIPAHPVDPVGGWGLS